MATADATREDLMVQTLFAQVSALSVLFQPINVAQAKNSLNEYCRLKRLRHRQAAGFFVCLAARAKSPNAD